MRYERQGPGLPARPVETPAIPPVDARYAPPRRFKLPGTLVWLLVTAGLAAGTTWAMATPPATSCDPQPTLNQCRLNHVYAAQLSKAVAGMFGGFAIAMLLEGGGAALSPRPRRRGPGRAATAHRRPINPPVRSARAARHERPSTTMKAAPAMPRPVLQVAPAPPAPPPPVLGEPRFARRPPALVALPAHPDAHPATRDLPPALAAVVAPPPVATPAR